MTSTVDDCDDIRILLRSVDAGRAPEFDADTLMARGTRSRRVHGLDRWLAVAAAALVIGGVAFGIAHLGSPAPAPQQSTSPSPTPRPTTASQYLAAAEAAIRAANNVHVVSLAPTGAVLDLVVSQHYAIGTLSVRGVTSRYVADENQVYIQPAALGALGYLTADDVVRAHGRWIVMIGSAPFNEYRTAFWLAASLDSPGSPVPTLAPRVPSHVTTVTLVRKVGAGILTSRLEIVDQYPYRPVQIRTNASAAQGETFTEWDSGSGPSVTPPTFPAADNIYDPSEPTG